MYHCLLLMWLPEYVKRQMCGSSSEHAAVTNLPSLTVTHSPLSPPPPVTDDERSMLSTTTLGALSPPSPLTSPPSVSLVRGHIYMLHRLCCTALILDTPSQLCCLGGSVAQKPGCGFKSCPWQLKCFLFKPAPVVSSYQSCNNKPMYGYMLPNLSPSPNLYKVQSVYNNTVASYMGN